MNPSRRATIVDVAARAGVSPKTVSRVLNGEPHVTAAVQSRVRAAAEALNYVPNPMAQRLVGGRSYLIGLIYEKPSASYVVELQMGALDRLEGERYRLVVLPVRSVREAAGDIVPLIQSAALDAVVLGPPASDHLEVIEALAQQRLPFARIAPTRALGLGPSVMMDDVAAAREIAEHVIGLGHRRLAIIKGDPAHASADARLLGYSQAMGTAGIAVRLDWIECGFYVHDAGHAAAMRLLREADRPTAILAQNDEMGVAAMMAARDLGLDVPGDVSIVGFDDTEVSRIVWPRLTTVHQPVLDLARAATDLVLAQLAGETPAPMTVLPHKLLIRQSTAPPKA